MSTATLDRTELTTTERPELVTFNARKAEIATLSEQYMPLKIAGLDDKKGYELVHAARMKCVAFRTAIEKRRVELKADSLKYGRDVDSAAKAMTALLAPIEDHLESEESVVVNERERIRREAEEAKAAKLKQRVDALVACGWTEIDPLSLGAMSDELFQAKLTVSRELKAEADAAARRLAEQERQRLADEAEDRRKEAEALAAERAKLEAIQRQQLTEAARLRAEQQRIADAEAAKARAAELEAARKEAAEKAAAETEHRLAAQAAKDKADAEAREAKSKADAEAAAARKAEEDRAIEAARLKAEAERPQREKLLAVADAVKSLPVPDGPGSKAVITALFAAVTKIRAIANGPLE